MASTDQIDLNLDEVTREESYKPFVFSWKGRTISLSDPAELDWGQLAEVESPVGFLRYTASQEDRDFLASKEGRMEGWRLGKLIERYYKHFGIDPQRNKIGF